MGAYWIKTRVAQCLNKVKYAIDYTIGQVDLEAKEKTLEMISARAEAIGENNGRLHMTEVEAMNYISQVEHAKVRCKDWVSKRQWVEVVNGAPVVFKFKDDSADLVSVWAYSSMGRGDVTNWVVYEENNL